jgi:hypothetical protein
MLHDQNVSKTDIDFMDAIYSNWGGSVLLERKKEKEAPIYSAMEEVSIPVEVISIYALLV